MKYQLQQGFTLIELMIVIAIIGILAAIAIPSYNDYIARSQVSEAVSLMSGGKTPMAEFFADNGRWPLAASSVMGTTSGKYTQSIGITAGSAATTPVTLTATMKPSGVNVQIQSKTITLTSTSGTNWTCKNGTVLPVHVPGSCR